MKKVQEKILTEYTSQDYSSFNNKENNHFQIYYDNKENMTNISNDQINEVNVKDDNKNELNNKELNINEPNLINNNVSNAIGLFSGFFGQKVNNEENDIKNNSFVFIQPLISTKNQQKRNFNFNGSFENDNKKNLHKKNNLSNTITSPISNNNNNNNFFEIIKTVSIKEKSKTKKSKIKNNL